MGVVPERQQICKGVHPCSSVTDASDGSLASKNNAFRQATSSGVVASPHRSCNANRDDDDDNEDDCDELVVVAVVAGVVNVEGVWGDSAVVLGRVLLLVLFPADLGEDGEFECFAEPICPRDVDVRAGVRPLV